VTPPATFSVVVPLFDKAPFLRRTIGSVLRQTCSPLEVIVVDDGSTDGGAETIADLLGEQVRIVRQDNAGPGAARNRGCAEARGAWIALLDADDLWLDDHLETLAGVIAAFPHAHVVAAASRRETPGPTDDAKPASRGTGARPLDFFRDHRETVLNAYSVAILRSAFATTTGFGTARVGEDSEFWVRLALDHAFAVSDRATAVYVRGNGGIMEQQQARMARGTPMLRSPMFETLDRALADPRHAARHPAIRAYADRIRIEHARSLVYHGRTADARDLLAAVSGRRALFWRTLARLPGPALASGARFYSALKHRRRSSRRTP
jgi:glycosyltransferase involved in cell wall biosynthesis